MTILETQQKPVIPEILTDELLSTFQHTVPAPLIWFDSYDEEIYPDDVVCFYDHIHDRDGFGTFDSIIFKHGREYARIIETKVWLRPDYMQEGIWYRQGDAYEEPIEVPIERMALADEMLDENDCFSCVNYYIAEVS